MRSNNTSTNATRYHSKSVPLRLLIVLVVGLIIALSLCVDGFATVPVLLVSSSSSSSASASASASSLILTMTMDSNATVAGTADSNQKKNRKHNLKKKAMYTFSEARKIARGHGFETQAEFLEYACPGAYQLPKNADEVWETEWTNWDDFLGVIIPEYNAARAIVGEHLVRNTQFCVSTEEDYKRILEHKLLEEDNIASRLPYQPDRKYKTKGWVSWDHFLSPLSSSSSKA